MRAANLGPSFASRRSWKLALLLSMLVSARAAPNIVWIMADDMGFGEVGSFPATSAVGRIRTPHLDQLADSGLKFYGPFTRGRR